MNKASLLILALALFITEIGSAQISIQFGNDRGRNPNNGHRNPRNRINPGNIGVGIDIGGVKLNFGMRSNHWRNRRVIIGQSVDQALYNEREARLIGYTMISDNGYDYDNVEIRNRDNIDAIKLKIINDGVRIDNLSIRFCDNSMQNYAINQRFSPNSSTQWLDLPGRTRCISSFAVSGQGDRDGLEATVILLGKNLPHVFDRRGHFQSRRNGLRQQVRQALRGNSESGERLVGFSMLSDENFDHENVDVNNQEMVDEVRLRVIGDNAFINTLSVQFCDGRGQFETWAINQTIPANGSTVWIDLRGNNRCIASFAVSGKGDRGYAESTIILTGRNRPGNDYSNYPNPSIPVPVQFGPKCEFLGSGSSGGFSYNHRLGINGQVVKATDNFNDMLGTLDQLLTGGTCHVEPGQCSLAGNGRYAGFSYNFRLTINGTVIYATDNFNDLIASLNKLQQKNACHNQPASQCQLLGPGNFSGFSYQNRIGISNVAVFASDNVNDTLTKMATLKQNGLCY